MNLRLLQGISVPYQSLQESLAIMAWRKQERIELLKTIANVTAAVNPEKAATALQRLIEEMFPEHQIERAKAVDRAMEIMEEERHKVYSVTPSGVDRKSSPLSRVRSILGKKNRRPTR